MQMWTVQLCHWRKLKDTDITLLDSTIKTGDVLFSPSWVMVRDYKAGNLSPERYKEEYINMMRDSYRNNKEAWLAVLQNPKVAIGCYCKPGEFCHRHLLIGCFSAVAALHGIDFEYVGEWSK